MAILNPFGTFRDHSEDISKELSIWDAFSPIIGSLKETQQRTDRAFVRSRVNWNHYRRFKMHPRISIRGSVRPSGDIFESQKLARIALKTLGEPSRN